jgi:hypothetical protein
VWWQIIFWALLVPCLIVLGIVYGTSKKLYKLFYILATFTYVITIAYVIDVYELDRNWILGLLTFSAVLMILLGYRLTRKDEGRTKRPTPTRRPLTAVLIILGLMLILIIVSALNLGARRDVSVAQGVSREELLFSDAKGYPQTFPTVANLTYTNSFIIPYVVPDQYFIACWYDSAKREYAPEQPQVMLNGQYAYGPSNQFDEVSAGETVQRRVDVGQQFVAPVDPKGAVNETARQEVVGRYRQYDFLVLVASSDPIAGCADVERQRQKGRLTLYQEIPLTE